MPMSAIDFAGLYSTVVIGVIKITFVNSITYTWNKTLPGILDLDVANYSSLGLKVEELFF